MDGKTGLMPYNFVELENGVEITLYGDVVQNRPVDFWTGEPIQGLFIVVAEFLEELEKIKDKEQVIVHINSGGGDLYAGIAIYNRLKELNNVTTIVDGLAASAASIILQAGKTRKVYAGSQVMVHGASLYLNGGYNVEKLEESKKSLEAGNNAALQTYLERTGLTAEQIQEDMKTSWMTGEEAIQKKYADELITGKKVEIIQKDKTLYVNHIPMGVQMFAAEMPKNIKKIEGEKEMNLKELKEKYPEFVQQIQAEGKEQLQNQIEQEVQKERARLAAIEEIEKMIGDENLIKEAKYGEKRMTAQELSFVALKQQAQLGKSFLNNMLEDTNTSGTGEVNAIANQGEQINSEEDEIKAAAELIAGGLK